jgi:membrane-bound lytic murein transglycosylase D
LEGSLRAARIFALLLAGLPLGCASGGAVGVAAPGTPAPPAAQVSLPAADPAPALIARADAHLKAGLAAADQGDLDGARSEFDRAIEALTSFPGGALADPRVAEAYRRTLDTVQVREVELVAAASEEELAAAEPAAIDGVGELPVSDAPASAETMAQAVAAVESETLDLAVELNDAVLSCIDLYQGRLRDWFQEALARGQKYLPEIRRVFAEEGIPQDLAYVALVESAFKTNAYSRAKARGVFQFVSATGRRYGLKVDWWVDERSDPDKATRAAARYLKDLYTLFGDWNLALAGYNAGEGKVLRGMARYRKSDFWELRKTRALRRETKNYVPLVHAAIVLAKAPERYGFVVSPDTRPEWEHVAVAGAYALRVVAECAGETVEALRELNPELRRLVTPAYSSYDLRVPPGRGEQVRQCLAELPADQKVTYRKHVVRRGQTLSSIARANGVSAQAIAEANLLASPRRLRPGTELVIPVAADRARVVQARREASRAGQDGDPVRYRIQPGDTLSSIAADHGTTVRQLQAWNGLRGTRIVAGSLLTIYSGAARD